MRVRVGDATAREARAFDPGNSLWKSCPAAGSWYPICWYSYRY